MKIELEPRVAAAVSGAVRLALATLGVAGLRSTSLFPSSMKNAEQKIAA